MTRHEYEEKIRKNRFYSLIKKFEKKFPGLMFDFDLENYGAADLEVRPKSNICQVTKFRAVYIKNWARDWYTAWDRRWEFFSEDGDKLPKAFGWVLRELSREGVK